MTPWGSLCFRQTEVRAADPIVVQQGLVRPLEDDVARLQHVAVIRALERRTQQAQDKITRAESQAVDEVRAAAIEVALAAAEKILREKTAGSSGASLIDQSIRDLKGRLN